MGTTLVIPTKEEKMEFPRMAPNLQSPLRMPKAVALWGGKQKAMVRREVLAQPQKVWMGNLVNALMFPRLYFQQVKLGRINK